MGSEPPCWTTNVKRQFYLEKWLQAMKVRRLREHFRELIGRIARRSNAEALATATFAGDIRVAKAKRLIQPFLDEVDLGAVD